MASKKDPNSPATTSAAYDEMVPIWNKVTTVLAGTEAMRAAGETYLPQHNGEEDATYQERLETNVLLNYAEVTLSHWVGKPFSGPMKLSDEASDPMREIAEDVDLEGSGLTVFAREWFWEGLSKAFSHVMVEFPRRKDPEGRPRTLADDRKENLRPYWVHIQPERVIAMRSTRLQGQEVLTHVRIKEDELVAEGEFSEAIQQRVRVLDLVQVEGAEDLQVRVRLFAYKKEGGKEEWIIEDDYFMDGMNRIPFVTFYAARDGLMRGKPPILDLVNLNIRHWQSSSDQFATLTAARFPMLAASGVRGDDTGKMKIGPRQLLHTKSENGKFYYVEHTGAAIDAGRQELVALEGQMQAYGAQFLVKQPGGTTATERAIDSAESTSALQDAVFRFTDAVARVLDFTAKWMRDESDVKVTVTGDLDAIHTSKEELDALIKSRETKNISRETFLEALIERGLLPEDLTVADEVQRMEQELHNELAAEVSSGRGGFGGFGGGGAR